jgi:tetratricopeptide (TPR) repeat protein
MANYFEQVLLNAKKQAKVKSATASPVSSHGEPPKAQLDGLIALLNQRRLKEVVQHATALAAELPNAAVLFNILGAAYMGLRNLDGAIASFSRAVQLKPGFAPAHNNLGVALKDKGRLTEAVASFNKTVQLKPDFAEAYNNLGIALKNQGRFKEAVASFGKALQIKPDYAEAHSSLGTALQGQGRLDEAIASYDKALQIKPDLAEAHNNRGAALNDQGRFDEAIASFGKALAVKADYFDAYNNLGLAMQGQGRMQEAIGSFSKALQIRPDYAEAHNNVGVSLHSLGLLDEAIASFGKALTIKPNYPEAHSNLCGLYEKQNNIEELERALEEATRICGEDHLEILFRLAQLASRKNQHEAAAGYLKRIQVEKIQSSLKASYFSLLGKSCDKLGRSEEAFSAFINQNELTLASAEAKKFSSDGYLTSIQMRRDDWVTDAKPNWPRPAAVAGQISPTFLVGFPRSGTTLLDTILRSHPEISVVEEKPMAGAVSKAFNQGHTIENFNGLSEAGVLDLRTTYFNELKKHLEQDGSGKLVVDKYPLNIVHVGLVHRVFPNAKFILALRHPCDCVLSCFMQTFKLNEAMMSFLSLQQSAELYAAIMELWSAYRKKLNLQVHVLKYEDLVHDLEGTCKPLIGFLGLEWDDNLHNYQKTAAGRGSINTPSYSQVVQPLYKQASGRWTHYRKQMEPVLPVLQPWIEAFGY